MSTDYTQLITSEHQLPDFEAVVALVANGVADISAIAAQLSSLFDLDNAQGAQLDVVGQWVGVSRAVSGVLAVNFFGFADDASALPFSELGQPATGGRFIELGESATASAILSDPNFLLLIQAKIIANSYDGSVGELEAAFADLTNVACKFFDPGTRTVLLLPAAPLDPVLVAELTQFDILPRPAGVRYQIVQTQAPPYVWTTVAQGTTSNQGQTVSKTGGVAAFDSSAYIPSPQQHILMSWTVPDITHRFMAGLAANPSGSPNFPTLNYAFDFNFGTLSIFESGSLRVSFTYAPGDKFTLYYDGLFAVWIQNGKIIRDDTSVSPLSLSPMFCLFSPGATATNISIAQG